MPIDLLPRKRLTFSETFFSFLLTYGRFIIIGTEVIVLSAFVLRFKLDRDLIDLHDKIKQKEAIVKSLGSIERRSRSLQMRLSEIVTIHEKSERTVSVLSGIPSLVPANVFLDEVSLSDKRLSLSARTASGEGLSSFVKRVQSREQFSDVSLETVTRDETLGGQIRFTVTVTLKHGTISK